MSAYRPDDKPPDWFDDHYHHDPRNPKNDPPPHDDPRPEPEDLAGAYDEAEGKPPEIDWTVAASLAGKSVPPRRWVVEDWLPVGTVTSLYGKGGVGKSLVAQQLATSVSMGLPFFGLRTTQCRVLGVFCEDDGDELHRRQAAICDQDIPMASLVDFTWTARAGEQNSLVHESSIIKGMLDWSGLFMAIEEAAKKLGARLVILDNIAQLFGANENDRALVTSFVNRLHKLAYEIEGAVLLLGHPGKGGVATEYSGSTAWDAAVRSRWLLRRPEAEDDEEEGAGDFIRELAKVKANYSSIGDTLTLEWDRGCFHLLGGAAPGFQSMGDKCAASARESQVAGLILKALDTLRAQKRNVSASKNASNGAAKIMLGLKEFKTANVRKREIAATLERLFDEGRIRNGMAVWQKPSRHWAEGIGRVEWPQPERSTAALDPDDGEEGEPE